MARKLIEVDYFRLALIIEDDVEICQLIETILTLKNISCLIAHSLNSGKFQLQNYEPDFIFLDHNLPDGFGLDSINELKELRKEVVIIGMTALDEINKETAISMGADAFLKKPFKLNEIYSIIDTFILKDQ